MIFVTGPGHGGEFSMQLRAYLSCIMPLTLVAHAAPAILSNLYIEGAISKFYPQWALDKDGLEKFVRAFSWPGGLPSHINVGRAPHLRRGICAAAKKNSD
jgi:phosphoketolase